YLVEARAQAGALSRAETPETQMMRQEAMQRAQRILDHLEALPPDERELVDLRYHQGWTAREIAERRGVPTRQVFTVLERVRRLLKRAANRIDTTLEER
ncbi:MAG: sigma-70 family RNA polymerase sigma factor, partial [Gemmatimonadetes bacterium]|nr:sigma-70 family RNA polymerase sigma factor [Gemmatimonadota bacterium]